MLRILSPNSSPQKEKIRFLTVMGQRNMQCSRQSRVLCHPIPRTSLRQSMRRTHCYVGAAISSVIMPLNVIQTTVLRFDSEILNGQQPVGQEVQQLEAGDQKSSCARRRFLNSLLYDPDATSRLGAKNIERFPSMCHEQLKRTNIKHEFYESSEKEKTLINTSTKRPERFHKRGATGDCISSQQKLTQHIRPKTPLQDNGNWPIHKTAIDEAKSRGIRERERKKKTLSTPTTHRQSQVVAVSKRSRTFPGPITIRSPSEKLYDSLPKGRRPVIYDIPRKLYQSATGSSKGTIHDPAATPSHPVTPEEHYDYLPKGRRPVIYAIPCKLYQSATGSSKGTIHDPAATPSHPVTPEEHYDHLPKGRRPVIYDIPRKLYQSATGSSKGTIHDPAATPSHPVTPEEHYDHLPKGRRPVIYDIPRKLYQSATASSKGTIHDPAATPSHPVTPEEDYGYLPEGPRLVIYDIPRKLHSSAQAKYPFTNNGPVTTDPLTPPGAITRGTSTENLYESLDDYRKDDVADSSGGLKKMATNNGQPKYSSIIDRPPVATGPPLPPRPITTRSSTKSIYTSRNPCLENAAAKDSGGLRKGRKKLFSKFRSIFSTVNCFRVNKQHRKSV